MNASSEQNLNKGPYCKQTAHMNTPHFWQRQRSPENKNTQYVTMHIYAKWVKKDENSWFLVQPSAQLLILS